MPGLTISEGHVEYDDVAFGYGDGKTIVEDIFFEVDGGEMLVLVGPTGGGKSTILKLLIHMYDPDEEHISIDNQDVHGVTISSLREPIAYISQGTLLFYGTVHDNITHDMFDADDEAVVVAAEAVKTHKLISNLPEGYDAKVGERGVKLSDDRRRRASIARIVLKDPDALVLDEATSDVDTETEMLIQCSLDELMADRAAFNIAHRLLAIKDAEQIVVLENGRIVKRETRDNLLSENDLYTHLWGVQAGEIDQLPDEFVERAARRQAEIDADDG